MHWPGPHPLDQTLAAFEKLSQDGKIRFYGVSNFDEDELSEAVRLAGPRRIACNQVLYHLKERAIEHRVMPMCERHEVAVVGYSPFGSGDFPRRSRVLDDLARAHGVTAHAVALAFLTRLKGCFAIPKAASPAHALDNAKAGDLRLSPAEIARIDEAFPPGPERSGIPTL